jgi:hypothetical protein
MDCNEATKASLSVFPQVTRSNLPFSSASLKNSSRSRLSLLVRVLRSSSRLSRVSKSGAGLVC